MRGPVLVLLLIISTGKVFGAPNGPIDFPISSINCDTEVRVSIIGDSIVTGAGDSKNGERGGYVKRLNDIFRGATFENYGKYGYTTAQIRAYIRATLRSRSEKGRLLRTSDLVIIDAGRNDWKTHRNPTETVATLRSLVRVLQRLSTAHVIVGTNIPTTKSGQDELVRRNNRALLKASTDDFPVKIRFDRLPDSVLSDDDIHPSSSGYDAIANFLINYFVGKFLDHIEVRTRDSDNDGTTDWCEAQDVL